MHPFLGRSLINWIWFEDFLRVINYFGPLLMRLDETVRKLLFSTGLKKYEVAMKLVQLLHLHPQGRREKQKD